MDSDNLINNARDFMKNYLHYQQRIFVIITFHFCEPN